MPDMVLLFANTKGVTRVGGGDRQVVEDRGNVQDARVL